MSVKVMLVEDETDIREMLALSFMRAGLEVVEAETAEECLQKIEQNVLPDVMIIDWMLPGMSGIELVRRVRKDTLVKETPIIMLTARGEEVDKLKSFEVGVDDYVTKPFSPRELNARVAALMRRSGTAGDGKLRAGDIELDHVAHRLLIRDEPVHIGPTEFKLLEWLMRHPDRVYEREQLLDRVWGRTVLLDERTVDVHVLRLRKVLAPFDLDAAVQTVRGVGYRFSVSHKQKKKKKKGKAPDDVAGV
ncbi:MAG: phosphate regulon transcriptional regulator PhoB [Gammaproteobacteria bacterium]|nr:phosphate regulon transcriptional regulator PhoB [Gammaproteobacteria bacterium]